MVPLSFLIWTAFGNFMESSAGQSSGWMRADKIRLNKRKLDESLLPMYVRLTRNRNNQDRNRFDKRIGSMDTRVVKAGKGRLDKRLATSSNLKAVTNRERADRSRLDTAVDVMEMIRMDMKDIYVGSLNETFPIPLYLKASTLVNSVFGVLGGGGLLAGGAALLGATGSSSALSHSSNCTGVAIASETRNC